MGMELADIDAVLAEIRPTLMGPRNKEQNPPRLKAPGLELRVRTVLLQLKYIYCNTFTVYVIHW